MLNHLVGIIFCLAAFQRAAQAIETNFSSSVVVLASSPSLSSNCSKVPPAVDLKQCCSLLIPFDENALSFCQAEQTRWMKDRRNGTTCGSKCILAHLASMPGMVQDFMTSFPMGWMNVFGNIPVYFNAASQCLGKLSFEPLFAILPRNITDIPQEPICQIDLLGFAECFSRQVFVTCPQLSSTKDCQAVMEYLNRPCLYSGLAIGFNTSAH